MPVAIGPRVLVPEADDVSELVYDDAELITILADADGLRSVSPFADEGAAAAGPLGEHNVILMLVRHALDEFDTGEVFPVTHRLLEESLVGTAEVAVDLVRNYPVVPDAFLASCRGASSADQRLLLIR